MDFCNTNLLSRGSILHHVEVNVFERSCLRNLPVDGADVRIGIRASNIDLEIFDASQEVVRVDIPGQDINVNM